MARDGCSKNVARAKGYAWLSEQTGVPRDHCHIAMMDDDMLGRVIRTCRPYAERIAARAAAGQLHA